MDVSYGTRYLLLLTEVDANGCCWCGNLSMLPALLALCSRCWRCCWCCIKILFTLNDCWCIRKCCWCGDLSILPHLLTLCSCRWSCCWRCIMFFDITWLSARAKNLPQCIKRYDVPCLPGCNSHPNICQHTHNWLMLCGLSVSRERKTNIHR